MNSDRVIDRRHHEFLKMEVTWQRILDSLEGGNAYRDAVYGIDSRNLPIRNLVRHKREYPLPTVEAPYAGPAPGNRDTPLAMDDPYEQRRARTPIPRILAEGVGDHVARIYSEKIKRDGPAEYLKWAGDVDGAGTTIDTWMGDTVARLLLALGCLDIALDRPATPGPISQAQAAQMGLDRVIAAYILPTNVLWWILSPDPRKGHYEEVLIRESRDAPTGKQVDTFRHWTRKEWVLYDGDGKEIVRGDNPYGAVPIFRAFVARRPRSRNLGQSIYEGVLSLEQEFYNTSSEIVLSNTLQAHAILQGPQGHARDGVKVGPSWTVEMGKDDDGTSVPWSYIAPPKDGFQALRDTQSDLRDAADSLMGLLKPAGTTDGATVSQSGASKAYDHDKGSKLLKTLASALQGLEMRAGRYALMVHRNGLNALAATPDGSDPSTAKSLPIVEYPSGFNLYTADGLSAQAVLLQGFVQGAGSLPITETRYLTAWISKALPGLKDEDYQAMIDEITAYMQQKQVEVEEQREASLALQRAAVDAAESPPENTPSGTFPAGPPR